MKIVEATWEARNLGRLAFEVSLEKRDNINNVLNVFSEERFKNAYVTLKMPVGTPSSVHRFEDAGFRFMETQIELEYDIRKYKTPPGLKGVIEPVSIREIPHELSEWKSVTNRITPQLFTTDRIALDPLLGPEIGCRRYRNWILDLANCPDAHLLVFGDPSNSENEYGFSLDKFDVKTGVLHVILGGVFADCDKPGIGLSIWDASYKNDILRGVKLLRTAISSNNPGVIALDSALGIEVRRLTYVLRKQFGSDL